MASGRLAGTGWWKRARRWRVQSTGRAWGEVGTMLPQRKAASMSWMSSAREPVWRKGKPSPGSAGVKQERTSARESQRAATWGARARRRGAAWTVVFFPPLLDGDGGEGGGTVGGEVEEGLQGLELAEEAASGHGVGRGGGEERGAGIEEVDLEGEEGGTEGVDVRAVVDDEDEGVATKDPDEGILHELQVGFDGWRVHGLKF